MDAPSAVDENSLHPFCEEDKTQDLEAGLSPVTTVDLARTRTDRIQYELTVSRSRINVSSPALECPSMGRGKPIPARLSKPDNYLVEFDGPDDPRHPFNWEWSVKLLVSVVACLGTLQASFNSAIFAPGTISASSNFHVSAEIGTLGTTLYVLGFAFGPIIWAPASEIMGRRWPMILGIFGDSIFTISTAVAKDIQTLIICRFFSGMFGASQLSIVPAVLADVFDNKSRGSAISIYALTVFGGPFSAPFIGGFIEKSFLGWRWTLYIPAFMGFANATSMLLWLKETYSPVILQEKAAEIRRYTHNWAIHAKQDEVELDFAELVHNNFTRPLRILITEPVILFVSIYMSFVYGLVYALVEAIPYVFEKVYGMSAGVNALPFIALILGQVVACTYIVSQHSSYIKKLAANGNVPIPEWRLFPTLIGAPAFAIGIFWFSWTGFTDSIHWIVPTLAGCLIGFGILCIFLPCFNYLVDSFLPIAASTVAANIIARSAFAAGFPLFTKQMYENLGVQWAGTLLGCLAVILIPIPFVLRKVGKSLREKSKLAIS